MSRLSPGKRESQDSLTTREISLTRSCRKLSAFRRGSRILKWGVKWHNGRVDRPGLDDDNTKAWKRGVFGLHAEQCVCGLKMNKLIGRTSHRLCTFSTSIREIKYYFNIWGIRKKRKKRVQKKGGWKFTHFTSPGSAPGFNKMRNFAVCWNRSFVQ